MGPDEIRQELADWKRNGDRRDMLVKMAHQADIQIKEISQLSGLSRTTIYRILGLDERDEPEPRGLRAVSSADPRDRIMKRLAGMPEEGGGQ